MTSIPDGSAPSMHTMPTPHGTYRLLHATGTDYFYLTQKETTQGVARRLQANADVLWERYLERGGELFRDGLFAKHGCERVTFTDVQGAIWILFEWAMDFCNLYDPELKESILTYYRHHKMGVQGPQVTLDGPRLPALQVSYLAQLGKLVKSSLEGLDLVHSFLHQVNGRVEGIEALQRDTIRQVAATDRRVDHLAGAVKDFQRTYTQYERTVRGFLETFCGHTPSVKEAQDHGLELTKRYGHRMPLGKFPKTPCRYGGQPVNYYEAAMLIEYFTAQGLYTPMPP